MDRERRQAARHALVADFKGWPLESLDGGDSGATLIDGSVQNISADGLGVATSAPVETSDPIRCEVVFPQMPVAVTLLVQKRWVHKLDDDGGYLTGLQFLL